MTEAGAWDGVGSSVVGGLIGALTVLLGVWLAYWFAERSRIAAREEDRALSQETDRRNAANGLIIQVSNLRDDACSRRAGLLGNYKLFPLRNALFVSHVVLDRLPSYQEVRAFYDEVDAWRDWIREHKPPNPPSTRRPDDEYNQLRAYQAELRKYAEWVISLLQNRLEDVGPMSQRPSLLGRPM